MTLQEIEAVNHVRSGAALPKNELRIIPVNNGWIVLMDGGGLLGGSVSYSSGTFVFQTAEQLADAIPSLLELIAKEGTKV